MFGKWVADLTSLMLGIHTGLMASLISAAASDLVFALGPLGSRVQVAVYYSAYSSNNTNLSFE